MSSSLSRILNVLNLFNSQCLEIDTDVIGHQFSLSRTSSYRYLKELCEAGLLAKRGPKGYVLGPRLIELDWMMRHYDPLLSNGQKYFEELTKRTGLAVFLSNFYDNKIINTFILSPNQELNYTYGRGRPLPLFRGAQSKVLTSHQPIKKIKYLYEHFIAKEDGQSSDLNDILKQAKQIRKDRFCITYNELNMGYAGIATPIFLDKESKEVHTSICVVGSHQQFELFKKETIIDILFDTSAKLTEEVMTSRVVTD